MKAGVLALLAMQATTLGGSGYSVDTKMQAPDRTPTFADEFNGPKIDLTKWKFETAMNPTGWPNHELEYYSDNRPENAKIVDGALVITARHEKADKTRFPDTGGQEYTSAKMRSAKPYGSRYARSCRAGGEAGRRSGCCRRPARGRQWARSTSWRWSAGTQT